MDDPIFDPWSIEDPPSLREAEAPLPPPVAPPAGAEPQAGPHRWSRSANEHRAPVARTRGRPTRRSEPPSAAASEEISTPPPTGASLDVSVEPVRSSTPHTHFLRNLLLPRLESLSARLGMVGHSTTIDERLTATPPSVRFRLTPRPGGFVDADEVAAAVLEVLFDDSGPLVAGRVWLDPQSDSPTSEATADISQANQAWLDRLLVDFVERTLGRA